MRVLHLALIILVIAVLGAVTVAWFDLAPIPVLTEAAYGMKGYALAKTPQEALDRYNKGLEARNYAMASRFLDGDYQIQFRKQAKVAERLMKAIDNFRHAAKDRGYNDDKVEGILIKLEPFPSRISIKDVKESAGGDSASAFIAAESGSRLEQQPAYAAVKLKKVDGYWRIDLPLDVYTRKVLEDLDRFGQDYTNALDVVKTRMKTDATTKENVFADLREETGRVKRH